MPLDMSRLKSDLRAAAEAARERYSGSDDTNRAANYEADLVAEAIDRFVRSGTVNTTVSVGNAAVAQHPNPVSPSSHPGVGAVT